MLKYDPPKGSPEDDILSDSVNRSPSDELVLHMLLHWVDPDPPLDEDDTFDRMGLSPSTDNTGSSWRLPLLCGCYAA